MSHVQHIQKNKDILERRSEIIKQIREFFWSYDFIEVETPLLVRVPGQEPYLSPMSVSISDEKGSSHAAYLHTSPEYTMKKMLAAGFTNIFSICKTFRNQESFGGDHNPEFTMLEWYRAGVDYTAIMDCVDALLKHVGYKQGVERIPMRTLWREYLDVDLNDYLDVKSMRDLCMKYGYEVGDDEQYEDVFYRIFLNLIEPKLNDRGAVMVYEYPAQMAALSKLVDADSRYAERFELYIDGIEIANAFSELTDADEQHARLEEEQKLRNQLGKKIYDIDEEFIQAVEAMPECAGIALGVDRLVMILLGCKEINDVIGLPMSVMFNE